MSGVLHVPVMVDVADLVLDEGNARHHGERSIDGIAESLSRFGQRKAIVVQRSGRRLVVRAGNGTVRAARELGWERILATVVEEDDARAAEYAIVDNRTAELSEWDPEMLERGLSALRVADVDVTGLGFTGAELTNLSASLLESRGSRTRGRGSMAEFEPGELWDVGGSRILVGDACDESQVARLAEGVARIDVVVCEAREGAPLEAVLGNVSPDVVFAIHEPRHGPSVHQSLRNTRYEVRDHVVAVGIEPWRGTGRFRRDHAGVWHAVRQEGTRSGLWSADHVVDGIVDCAPPRDPDARRTRMDRRMERAWRRRLAARLLTCYGERGSVVFDPFCWTPDLLLAGIDAGRTVLGMASDSSAVGELGDAAGIVPERIG